ncbi:hypothetical protein BDZ45DRAFT_698990 [Acephala macrosclerotiorum]|nr:hypothetical protein BDZ45DRAFT_698990 [Acephala macrosclerotiorum]
MDVAMIEDLLQSHESAFATMVKHVPQTATTHSDLRTLLHEHHERLVAQVEVKFPTPSVLRGRSVTIGGAVSRPRGSTFTTPIKRSAPDPVDEDLTPTKSSGTVRTIPRGMFSSSSTGGNKRVAFTIGYDSESEAEEGTGVDDLYSPVIERKKGPRRPGQSRFGGGARKISGSGGKDKEDKEEPLL